MKRFLFLLFVISALIIGSATYVYAQEPPDDVGASAIDLTTFTGIVAAVSLFVTQLAKIVPTVYEKTWLKIVVSVAVATVVSLLAWNFGWAQFLKDLPWWTAVFYGVGAGLTASGAYDLIKALVRK
jgi:fluoride ion exporter CrcB/FEX